MSETKKTCGIVMPISAIDDCSEAHWSEVLEVLSDSIDNSGFEANLVSNADDVGLIHKRIIQNLYDNPIVVCDVSAKNANVMFELGMRLAFDKPTIIVKDDTTSYSFDTSAIEHIEYPRDLRFSKIVEFKQKLSNKIKATEKKSRTDPEHTTFLKHFGEFKVAKLDKKEVSGEEFIIDEIKNIKSSIQKLEATMRHSDSYREVAYEKMLHDRLGSKHRIPNYKFISAKDESESELELVRKILERVNLGWKQENIISHFLAQGYPEDEIKNCLKMIYK